MLLPPTAFGAPTAGSFGSAARGVIIGPNSEIVNAGIAIACLEMLDALPVTENHLRRGLAEVARVLRPGGRLLIVDVRRPTTLAARALAALVLHGSAPESVEDLPDLLSAAGFVQLRAGSLYFGTLGYLLGQRVV